MDPEEIAKSIDDDQPTLVQILANSLIDKGYEVSEGTGPDWDAFSPRIIPRITVRGPNEYGYFGTLRVKDDQVYLTIYQTDDDTSGRRRVRGLIFNVHEKDKMDRAMKIIDDFVGPDELESR